MSHSKRNTSLAFFTAHERDELKGTWGSQATRLTRDSFLPFGSCQLCLLPAREPVSCPSQGHLFCRGCAVSNLFAQSQELKRLRSEAERRKLEDEDERELENAEVEARAIEDFERVQAGLNAHSSGHASDRIVGRSNGKVVVERDVEAAPKGTKRKFELDEDELKRIADDERALTKRRMAQEKNRQNELPSFWVPGETPNNKKGDVKAVKQRPTCPAAASDEPHDFSLKTLVQVHFSEGKNPSKSSTPSRVCPSCDKAISNSTKAVLAKPCGHVICKPCSDKFQKPPEKSAHDQDFDDALRCYVCQTDITPGRKAKKKKSDKDDGKQSKVERGLVELSCEGTGFAGGGKNMVKKSGLAFQC